MDTEIKCAVPWLVSKAEDFYFEATRNWLKYAIAEADAAGFEGTKKAIIAILRLLEQEHAATLAQKGRRMISSPKIVVSRPKPTAGEAPRR